MESTDKNTKDIWNSLKVGAGEEAGETATNSTECIYNARGLHYTANDFLICCSCIGWHLIIWKDTQ